MSYAHSSVTAAMFPRLLGSSRTAAVVRLRYSIVHLERLGRSIPAQVTIRNFSGGTSLIGDAFVEDGSGSSQQTPLQSIIPMADGVLTAARGSGTLQVSSAAEYMLERFTNRQTLPRRPPSPSECRFLCSSNCLLGNRRGASAEGVQCFGLPGGHSWAFKSRQLARPRKQLKLQCPALAGGPQGMPASRQPRPIQRLHDHSSPSPHLIPFRAPRFGCKWRNLRG